MPDLRADTATGTTPVPPTSRPRVVARWMVSFAGFPLGGLAAHLLTGRVYGGASALAGGLVTGAVLGAVQAWAMGRVHLRPAAWVLATALGMAAGLALGASLVGFRTGPVDLMAQGAVTGLVVGAAQAVVLLPRLGAIGLTWPVLLGGTWAAAWAVSTAVGVQVDEQFTVFGSAGALVAALLTAVLPLTLHRATERVGR